MKELNRRDFLKVAVGTGVGAIAVSQAPFSLLSGRNTETPSFSFVTMGPVPQEKFPEFAWLVVQGHVSVGPPVSGLLTQRIVPGYPASPQADPLPRLSLSARVEQAEVGSTITVRGTIDDAADWRYARDRSFELAIDRHAGTAVFRSQGMSHKLRLAEFREQ